MARAANADSIPAKIKAAFFCDADCGVSMPGEAVRSGAAVSGLLLAVLPSGPVLAPLEGISPLQTGREVGPVSTNPKAKANSLTDRCR